MGSGSLRVRSTLLRAPIVLALALFASLVAACQEEEEISPPAADTVETSATPDQTDAPESGTATPSPAAFQTIPAEAVADPTTEPLGTTRCASEACITVNSITLHPYKPESDGIDGVVIDVTIENRSGATTLAYSASEFTAVDDDRFVYQPTMGFGTPPLGYGTIPAGLKVRAQILFDVAEGARLVELRWDGAAGMITVPLTSE